jgi:hypothetical protein
MMFACWVCRRLCNMLTRLTRFALGSWFARTRGHLELGRYRRFSKSGSRPTPVTFSWSRRSICLATEGAARLLQLPELRERVLVALCIPPACGGAEPAKRCTEAPHMLSVRRSPRWLLDVASSRGHRITCNVPVSRGCHRVLRNDRFHVYLEAVNKVRQRCDTMSLQPLCFFPFPHPTLQLSSSGPLSGLIIKSLGPFSTASRVETLPGHGVEVR